MSSLQAAIAALPVLPACEPSRPWACDKCFLLFGIESWRVLFADLFHLVDSLAIELFHNGNVRHGRVCRGAMPILFAWWARDYVTGPDYRDRTSPTLRPAAACDDDQGLSQGVSVPCDSGAQAQR